MSSRLKQVNWLRRMVKKVKIVREYLSDARFLNRNLLDGGGTREHRDYQIMLVVHSVEKGLSCQSPRTFGSAKVLKLVRLLRTLPEEEHGSSAYSMGLGVLNAWSSFHLGHGWGDGDTFTQVQEFLDSIPDDSGVVLAPAGTRLIIDRDPAAWTTIPIGDFVRSRHSTRRYAPKPVGEEALREAVDLAIASPSSCNRQMVRFRVFDDPTKKRLLYDTLHGTSGVDYDTCRIGVITYDARSLEFYGERNQGYLNAGLFAMTLVYAFHWKGIGSCLLQFGNSFAEERTLAAALGVPESERIVVGLSFGTLESSDIVPASVRRQVNEVLSVTGDQDVRSATEIM